MRNFLWIFLWACGLQASAQQFTLSGQVRDLESGEQLGGVSVWDSLSGAGTFTNTYGFFSLTLAARPQVIRFSYVGYQPLYVKPGDEPLDIRLKRATVLEEVVISAPKTLAGNPVSLPMSEIRNMPVLLGEADVLKAFSFTPGVSAGNEGSAGLYVRGGTPDQNLILLDDVPVYNAMHLGGFFSVFNPASLKSADLYKGAFPARYGGRLSSVIDLAMKEGNNRKLGGEVGLGLMNQSLTLEGPIAKNKVSFIVSGRVSTLGLTSVFANKRKANTNTSGEDYVYKFHDLNAKVNYQISKTDHIYLSFYSGFDRFKYDEWSMTDQKEVSTIVGNNWGNNTGTIRYSKMLSPKLFSRAILIYSDYTSQFTNQFKDGEQVFYRYSDTRITDAGGKIRVDYYPKRWLEMRMGVDYTRHRFFPFSMTSNYTPESLGDLTRLNAAETSIFLDTDIKLAPRLGLNAGVRVTEYKVGGTAFRNPEPRLAATWSFADHWKLMGSATVMNQYLHLLVNNGYGFGYDAWLPATERIPPSKARQWSAGVSRRLARPGIDLSLEFYRKNMTNMIDYPDGTNFTGILADSWENIVKSGGWGRSSGLEVMGTRNSGQLRGRASYTLSRSELKFEEINEGQWYPMKYDRRHNLNGSATYAFNKKWSVNGTFIYQTGHAVTLPVGAVMYNGNTRYIYQGRNNGRMPAFHKLDLGVTRTGMLWKKYETKLGLGLYNAYNRANPLYLDFRKNTDQQTLQQMLVIKQYSMFPILPFINYTIKF